MADKKLTAKDIWNEVIKKVAPWIVILILGSIFKATWDVYAFSQTKFAISKTLSKHEADIESIGSSLDLKASKSHVEANSKKLDKVLTILCIMNKNKPTDCANR